MDNPRRSLDPRSLLPSVAVLAGIVLLGAAIMAAQGLFATVAFGALAAVICRRLQLLLLRRGMGSKAAVAVTVTAFVVVIGSLAAAFIASLIALAAEISGESETLAQQLKDLAASFGLATGLPPDSVPQVDVSMLLAGARSLLGMIGPAVTGLLMAFLIVTYLLLDADGLRARMWRVTSPGIIARYDSLAVELVVYIKVRAALGAAAAIADVVLLLALGVPYAILWGVVSFLFSFVPNIGFVLALIPPTVLAFLDGGIGAALAVVVGYTAINLAFDYVLQPRMMSTNLDISPVVVIVSILFWTFVIGAMGALLAVPLTIALRAVLLPYPGARWFVALLGPVPVDAGEPVEPSTGSAAPVGPRRPSRPPLRGHPHDRPRLPPLRLARPARRGLRARLHHRGRRRARVPGRRGRRDRRQRGSRAPGDRGRHRRAGGAPLVRPRFRVHDRAARALRRGGWRPPARGRPGDLPGVGRVRGDRDGAQAGACGADRARRDGPLGGVLALEQLPRQHARSARPVRAQAAPPPVRRLARAVPARERGLPVPRRRPGLAGPGEHVGAGRRARPGHHAAGPAPLRPSSASRSSGRRWARWSHPRGIGRRSRRSAGGTACC